MGSGDQTAPKTEFHAEIDNRVLHWASCHKAAAVVADAEVGAAAGAVGDEPLLVTDVGLVQPDAAVFVKFQCSPGLGKHRTCLESIVRSQMTPLAVGQESPAPSTVPLSLVVAESSQWSC